ncbi:hypothetical protein N8K70_06450 [Microbacterium betulae]|uniref:Uncharacterized protein n=1 Tax=Microbacterium betulae TaxID=2981139 RepID=A0AA97FJZ7_9MICO|nr:hypothetical protein [Microbacterium sp. AB]WOF24786.1 hypothetical protein N8K70_06450 [Microbacterium sp. AB]
MNVRVNSGLPWSALMSIVSSPIEGSGCDVIWMLHPPTASATTTSAATAAVRPRRRACVFDTV